MASMRAFAQTRPPPTQSIGASPLPPYQVRIGTEAVAISSGTSARILTGGALVPVECSPSGNCSSSNGPIQVDFSYSVSVDAPVIQFDGHTTFNNARNILVGQWCSAWIAGLSGGASANNYHWSAEGTWYRNWSASTSQSSLDANVDRTAAVAGWRWDTGSGGTGDGPSSTNVYVDTDVYYRGVALIGKLALVNNLQVWRPYQYMAGTFTGPTWFTTSPNDGAVGNAQITGGLGTPTEFARAGDVGVGGFAQQVELFMYLSNLGWITKRFSEPNWVLDILRTDTDWPYNPVFPASVGPNGMNKDLMLDTPGWQSFSASGLVADYYTEDYRFKTNLMYCPPVAVGFRRPGSSGT